MTEKDPSTIAEKNPVSISPTSDFDDEDNMTTICDEMLHQFDKTNQKQRYTDNQILSLKNQSISWKDLKENATVTAQSFIRRILRQIKNDECNTFFTIDIPQDDILSSE